MYAQIFERVKARFPVLLSMAVMVTGKNTMRVAMAAQRLIQKILNTSRMERLPIFIDSIPYPFNNNILSILPGANLLCSIINKR
jgi:cobalamin-dependent methionine synthase I